MKFENVSYRGERSLFSRAEITWTHECAKVETLIIEQYGANERKRHGINKEMQFASNQRREAAKTREIRSGSCSQTRESTVVVQARLNIS